MKKLPAFIFLLLAVTVTGLSQAEVKNGGDSLTPAQKEAFDSIGKLNIQAIELYRQKKYNDALRIALEARSLIEKNGLGENIDALAALSNLGEIYLAKNEHAEAIEIFQKVLSSYQKKLGEENIYTARTTERIAVS